MTRAERRALDGCYELAAYAVIAKDAGVENPDFIDKLHALESAVFRLPERDVRRWMRQTGFAADTPELRAARGHAGAVR